jgi:hypothetical protein
MDMMLDAMLHDMLGAIAELEKSNSTKGNSTETGRVELNSVKDITKEVNNTSHQE